MWDDSSETMLQCDRENGDATGCSNNSAVTQVRKAAKIQDDFGFAISAPDSPLSSVTRQDSIPMLSVGEEPTHHHQPSFPISCASTNRPAREGLAQVSRFSKPMLMTPQGMAPVPPAA